MQHSKDYVMMIVLIGICALLVTPTFIHANVFNDAYSYENAFEDDTGLNVEFDVTVSITAPHNSIIENSALLTAYTDPLDIWGSAFVTLGTNIVEVHVDDSGSTVIPEPSPLVGVSLGLLVLFALVRIKRSRK